MKLNLLMLIAIIAATPFRTIVAACAADESGAGSAPTGNIQISPSQTCGGVQTVAIGKNLTLTAGGLSDEDCKCGQTVQDSIDPSSGVKWVINQGTFTGGDMGTPKTWKAPTDPATSLGVRLKVDDTATASDTTDDGGFTEVASLNVNVVIPNNDVSTLDITPTCGTGLFGIDHRYKGRLSRTGCTVDFSGLLITETGCTETQNTCGYPPGSAGNGCGDGTVFLTVDGSNDYRHDRLSNCSSLNPTNCVLTRTLYWTIKASGGSVHATPDHVATFTIPAAGANSTTTSRTP